jgi:hypothetical protein
MRAVTMSMIMRRAIPAVLIGVWLLTTQAEAGGLGRAAARGLSRGLVRRSTISRSRLPLLRRDLARDHAIKARPLARPRTVFRYTSKARARTELRRGIAPGRHMTSYGGRGRPLGAVAAQRRYGLPRQPQVRETIHLPKGVPVRSAKAVGGGPGVGELTSSKRLPSGAITRVLPLGGK